MSSWPKEDRKIWEKSEIMSEFESQILKNIIKAGTHLKESDLKDMGTTTDTLKIKTDALNKSLQELDKTKEKLLTNSSNDQLNEEAREDDDASDCAMCGMSNDAADELCSSCYSKIDDSVAKNELINSLKKMADLAIKNKDIKSAYNIERTIQELEEND